MTNYVTNNINACDSLPEETTGAEEPVRTFSINNFAFLKMLVNV